MRKFLERLGILKSSKAHIPDPEKNDHFEAEKTKDHKIKENKLTRGKYFGKRWFPFNRG
jgi:phosphoribosylamine-glycine ligase